MAESYPYMISNNKIGSILSKIRSAAKPATFTHQFLKQLGFSSSNDRAIIPLLKHLGFIAEDGTPSEFYLRLKDNTDWQFVLGERIQTLYKELFHINTEIYKSNDDEIKGAFSRITGKDENSVNRYTATFKALISLAKFGASPKLSESEKSKQKTEDQLSNNVSTNKHLSNIDLCHNIQIHLPATSDVNVYNAIFKSIRENLLS